MNLRKNLDTTSGGDGKLKAGTDDTSEVTVHSLMTWGNPEVYVKGKKITVGDNYPSSDPKETQKIPTANWGGEDIYRRRYD